MHKKKNSQSVLSGEMILTFLKPLHRRESRNALDAKPLPFTDILDLVLERDVSGQRAFSTEILFNGVVLEAWRRNCLQEVSLTRESFAEELRERGWHYDASAHSWRKEPAARSALLWGD
jgi:hypothetical protein